MKLTLEKGLLAVDEAPRALERPLSATPPQGLDASQLPAGSWLHGQMPLTKKDGVPFAVDSGRKTLVFDANRDGKLEASERVAVAGVEGPFAWFATHVLIRQEAAGRMHELDMPVRIGVHLNNPLGRSRLDAYRAGTFPGPTRAVKIAIEDRTFRGWFTHPGIDALLVDVNGDGSFDASADSTERYRLGEPVPLDGIDAVVTAIGPLGSTLDFAQATKPARRIASLALGAPAPAIEATLLDGSRWTLEGQRGKWVLLDFWATWCGPCRGEIPNLKRASAEHADLRIIGFSADRARAALDQFLQAQAIDWPQVFEGAQPVQRTYRVTQFPTSFLVDPDGRIAARDLRGPALSQQIAKLKQARQAARSTTSR